MSQTEDQRFGFCGVGTVESWYYYVAFFEKVLNHTKVKTAA